MKLHDKMLLPCALYALVASCAPQNDSLLVVSVDGPDTIPPIYYLRVILANAGEQDYHQFPTNGAGTRITLPTSLGFNLARIRQGDIALTVDALDIVMDTVASGKGTATLKVGERVDMCIGLAPAGAACQAAGTDGGTTIPEGGVAVGDVVTVPGNDSGLDETGGLPAGLLFSRVAAGADHSCVVAVDGSLWCWGANGSRQLGNGGSLDATLPVRVAGGSWREVMAGYGETCALQSTADLWCWGNNGSGQLGNGTAKAGSSIGIPLQVPGVGWTSASVGEYHVVGVQLDGSLWTWGDNSSDQLGDPTAPSAGRASPGQVGAAQWLAVSSGSLHSCAIAADRTLWCWGNNSNGQIGDGTTRMHLDPTQAIGNDWATVSAGLYHTCATKLDGSLWCWGDNSGGQLGLGTASPSISPAQVAVPAAVWIGVTAGQNHTCGLQADQSLWCWGSNGDGQLGIGSNVPSSVPTAVAPGSGWSTASAGGAHTCAVAAAGTLWCWGRNGNGQLGVGGVAPRNSPSRLGP